MKKIVCYGAGEIGQYMLGFLEKQNKVQCIDCFIDKRKNIQLSNNEVEIVSPEEYIFRSDKRPIWITLGEKYIDEVIEWCINNKLRYFTTLSDVAVYLEENVTEWNRNFVAFAHIDEFEEYFRVAEQQLRIFWDANSIFYSYFKQLDLTNVIEIACGRGRHVLQYIDKASKVVLVDVLEKNIEYCRKRFLMFSNIQFYTNNGHDLCGLEDQQYSAIFSYDAMVHFEFMDIYDYLNEFYRVLKKGGMVLIHHSNNDSDYKISFDTGLHARNYMSKELFAFLAYRSGFEVVSQEVIDWGGVKDLDCISLLRKN